MMQAKKGKKPSWKPGSKLNFIKVPEGYRPRWCDSDESNVQKKLAEGWQFVNKTTLPDAEHKANKEVSDGGDASSALRFREMVAMMLPPDQYEERTAYYQNETEENTRARIATKEAKDSLGKYAGVIKPTISVNNNRLKITE